MRERKQRHESILDTDNTLKKIFENKLLGEEPITLDVVRLNVDFLANITLNDQNVCNKVRYIKSSMMVQSLSSTNQSASHFDSSEKESVSFRAISAANDEVVMSIVSD